MTIHTTRTSRSMPVFKWVSMAPLLPGYAYGSEGNVGKITLGTAKIYKYFDTELGFYEAIWWYFELIF